MNVLYKSMKKSIEQNYSCLVSYKLDNLKDEYLGQEAKPRRCRFCGKSEKETSFNKVAHAIPHFLGNKSLKSLYECDSCNEKVFGPKENHFAHYMGLFHVLSHVSKGGKVPIYKINSKDNSKIVVDKDWTNIYCNEDDSLSVEINEEKKDILIKSKRSYIPQEVYKILVKMALSIMPEEEMGHFGQTLQWLMSEKNTLPNLYMIVRLYESLLPFHGRCMVYKRNNEHTENVPCYLFGLAYYNIFIQIYLPLCNDDKNLYGKVTMPFIPCKSDIDGYKYLCFDRDMSSTEKVFGEDISLPLTYHHIDMKTDSNR